jgi:hypothetical protein
MILTPAYLREQYTGSDAASDAVLEQCLRAAIGEVEIIIGQPLEARDITWTFTGNGCQDILFPFSLNVLDVIIDYRSSIDQSWEEVANTSYEHPHLLCSDGFARGGMYRATAQVGLADVENGELLSADFSVDYSYELLRDIICEMAAAKFYASPKTNTGTKRSGLKSVSESVGGQVTKSQSFVDIDTMLRGWKLRLKPFMKVRVT